MLSFHHRYGDTPIKNLMGNESAKIDAAVLETIVKLDPQALTRQNEYVRPPHDDPPRFHFRDRTRLGQRERVSVADSHASVCCPSTTGTARLPSTCS